jgi:site-specific DNA recombinase
MILNRRSENKTRKATHDFAFSGLITCGHCGCALVGELKKRKYVYYHCTGYKGRCPEPYVREEELEKRFTELLRGLSFDEEVLRWVTDALRESHTDQKRHHDEAIARLQAEYTKLQNRIDAAYIDKLDGKIEGGFFERKATEWRGEQANIRRSIENHEGANQTYLTEGVKLLELASRSHALFEKQPASEKRRLLNFVLSNCTWKGGALKATFRQPFDIIANMSATATKKKAAGVTSDDLHLEMLGN